MPLKKLADDTMKQIGDKLGSSLSAEDMAAVSQIIEGALAEAAHHTTAKCTEAVRICCGPDQDIAHKIAEEADRARQALIANLMSMR